MGGRFEDPYFITGFGETIIHGDIAEYDYNFCYHICCRYTRTDDTRRRLVYRKCARVRKERLPACSLIGLDDILLASHAWDRRDYGEGTHTSTCSQHHAHLVHRLLRPRAPMLVVARGAQRARHMVFPIRRAWERREERRELRARQNVPRREPARAPRVRRVGAGDRQARALVRRRARGLRRAHIFGGALRGRRSLAEGRRGGCWSGAPLDAAQHALRRGPSRARRLRGARPPVVRRGASAVPRI